METKPYCVYNRTNESFLSLGVTLDGGIGPWLNELLRKTAKGGAEGRWFTRFGLRTIGMLESRDLVYLDDVLNVVATEEGFPAMRLAPSRAGMASILELPAGSIASTCTRIGHQLEICAADEMELRLRSASTAQNPPGGGTSERVARRDVPVETRRFSRRLRWPRLIAYDADGGSMTVDGVREIGVGGLYLMTKDRWPIGARVRLRLQREGGIDEYTPPPIIADLQVTRWGTDGIGLEFVQVTEEQLAILTMQVL